VATLLNIFIGVLAAGFLIFLFISERVPEGAKPGAFDAVSGGLFACLLVFFSVLALAGYGQARRAVLIVASLYFGTIIVQNALPLLGVFDSIVPTRKLAANVVRNAISLSINWWALTSSITLAFFASRSPPPNKSCMDSSCK
jgi:hypothetical protein